MTFFAKRAKNGVKGASSAFARKGLKRGVKGAFLAYLRLSVSFFSVDSAFLRNSMSKKGTLCESGAFFHQK